MPCLIKKTFYLYSKLFYLFHQNNFFVSRLVRFTMERSFVDRLHALGTEFRIEHRSNIHMYLQLHPESDETPIWILQAHNDTWRCQMHILEYWLCVWMAPDVGLFGNTTHEQWNVSPLVLPDEFFDRAKINGDVIDLSLTPLQALVRAFWYASANPSTQTPSAATSSAIRETNPCDAIPLMSVVRESIALFGKVLPLPNQKRDGGVPTLQLRRVRVAPGNAFFYDCWHILAPARATSMEYTTCPDKSPLSECLSDVSFVMVHENQFTADDRVEYLTTVLASLEIMEADETSEFCACLTGIDITNKEEQPVSEDDYDHFMTHGVLWCTWNDGPSTASSAASSSQTAASSATTSLSCPCQDIKTWLMTFCASKRAVDVFAQLYHHLASPLVSMMLVVPIDICDERLRLVGTGTRLVCYLPHQPPQDIALPPPTNLHALRDYSSYRPRASDDDKRIIQTFNVLSVETENRLVQQMYRENETDEPVKTKKRRA